MSLTSRDRIRWALAFERPDALPVHESPWPQTLAAWREQGLGPDADPADVFGWDLESMYLDTSPRFPQRVLGREGNRITYEDRYGYTLTKEEGVASTIRFHSHVTKDRGAWPEVKRRLVLSEDPDAPARIDEASYFGHFAPYPSWHEARNLFDRIRARERYLLFTAYGPWEATWRHRGLTELLLDTAEDPEWVQEMAEAYTTLLLDVLARSLAEGMRPDGVFLCEDLGMKTGPLMAPAGWRKILKPSLQRIGAFLEDEGIRFWLHTDGNVMSLLDDLVDCGVRVLNPLEVRAGMDIHAVRKRFGKRLACFGNLDAQAMSGPIEVLQKELRLKVPLAREGGFILHSDHSCPPAVTLDRYRWILDEARRTFHAP